jgi:hypothetical protein
VSSRLIPLIALGSVFASAAFAVAQDFPLMGDGSEADNADLLREGYPACDFACEPHGYPEEPFDPLFDIDWSLGLRGAHIRENDVARYQGSAVPTVTLSYQGFRSSFDLIGTAEIVKGDSTDARIGSLSLGFNAAYALDEVTSAAASGGLSLSQAAPSTPGNPSGTAVSPQIWSGEIEGSVTRDLKFVDLTLRGNASRMLFGETTLANGSVVNNSANNVTVLGGGLRLSHQLTPVFGVFGDFGANKEMFDGPSPSLLVKLDGTQYALRGGVTAGWGQILEAEASVGLGLKRFVDPTLPEVRATLYDASLTFRPDETLTISGNFSTSIGAPGPNAGGAARIEHSAGANAAYVVNPWLTLRASAGWRQASLIGSPETEQGYNLGTGLDYLLNEHTTINVDYTFSHSEYTPAAPVDTHTVTLGVTFAE